MLSPPTLTCLLGVWPRRLCRGNWRPATSNGWDSSVSRSWLQDIVFSDWSLCMAIQNKHGHHPSVKPSPYMQMLSWISRALSIHVAILNQSSLDLTCSYHVRILTSTGIAWNMPDDWANNLQQTACHCLKNSKTLQKTHLHSALSPGGGSTAAPRRGTQSYLEEAPPHGGGGVMDPLTACPRSPKSTDTHHPTPVCPRRCLSTWQHQTPCSRPHHTVSHQNTKLFPGLPSVCLWGLAACTDHLGVWRIWLKAQSMPMPSFEPTLNPMEHIWNKLGRKDQGTVNAHT